MSKSQLKKQVVQFYWQNLIQSYGVESKNGFKLDVKGKTINSNGSGGTTPGSVGAITNVPAGNQSTSQSMTGGATNNSAFNSIHYQMQALNNQQQPMARQPVFREQYKQSASATGYGTMGAKKQSIGGSCDKY